MNAITENEFETLKSIIAQAKPNEWTDFPGNGKSQRTHIGYLMETTIGKAQVPLFETNTNAKRADVLLAIYARNYLPKMLDELMSAKEEIGKLRKLRATVQDFVLNSLTIDCFSISDVEAKYPELVKALEQSQQP